MAKRKFTKYPSKYVRASFYTDNSWNLPQGPEKLDTQYMANILYDTLFGNTQYPQFDTNALTPLYSRYGEEATEYDVHEVDASAGIIRFGYGGKEFEVKVTEITK